LQPAAAALLALLRQVFSAKPRLASAPRTALPCSAARCRRARAPAPARRVRGAAARARASPFADPPRPLQNAGPTRASAAFSDAPAGAEEEVSLGFPLPDPDTQRTAVQSFLYPDPSELPDGACLLACAPNASADLRAAVVALSAASRARPARLLLSPPAQTCR